MEFNQNEESDIKAIVNSLTENLQGEEEEVVNIAEKREHALKIIAYHMIRRHKKRKHIYAYKKQLQRANYRLNLIKELVKTEETFVQKMHIIEDIFKKGMMKLLPNEEDINKIFANSQQILNLNETQFLSYLKSKTASLQFNSRVFDSEVLKIIPFFQIYLDYIQNYEISSNFLTKLKETRKDIKEFYDQFEAEYDQIPNLLITPVQRLPRYKLLFETLINKTPSDHYDFEFIDKCYKKFVEVCKKVNAQAQKYLDNQKVCELQQAFKHFNLNLIDAKTEFKFEERLTLIQDGEKNCIVNFLSDQILVQQIIDEETTKPIAILNLYQSSKVNFKEDMKYFPNSFKVSGISNNLTFMADNQSKMVKLMKAIESLINDMHQKDKRDNDLNIEVNILGTEEWNTTKIKKFTVYVAEVRILDIPLKIWVRYSQQAQLEKKIKSHIKNIEIDHFSTRFSWLNSHRTKIIEERKVRIEGFLKQILTIKKIRESEIIVDILNELGLPKDFYDLPYKSHININNNKNWDDLGSFDSDSSDQNDDDKNNKVRENKSLEQLLEQKQGEQVNDKSEMQDISNIKNKQKSNSIAAIGTFSSLETLKLYRESKNSRTSRLTFHTMDSLSQSERCLIDIEFLDGSKQEIEINSQTRCIHICFEIAKKISLKSYLDYRIFLKDSKGNFRVLDDDELLFKMLFPHPKSLQSNAILISNGNRISKNDITLTNNQQILQNLNDTSKIDVSRVDTSRVDTLNQDSQCDISHYQAGLESSPDNTTPIWKYSTQPENTVNLFKKIFKRLRSNFNFSEKYTIVFKKYLWLSPEQEEFDIRQDHVRLNLVCFQIFENISQQRYKFSFKDYALYSALYLCIKHTSLTDKIIQSYKENDPTNLALIFPFNKLKEILPDIIFNSKEESYWIENIVEKIVSVTEQIEKIQIRNQELIKKDKRKTLFLQNQSNILSNEGINLQSEGNILNNQSNIIKNEGNKSQNEGHIQEKEGKIQENEGNIQQNEGHIKGNERNIQQNEGIVKQEERIKIGSGKNKNNISKYTSKQILGEKIKLLQMVVINAIKQNALFGVSQFYVNTYKDTLKEAKEFKENVWLGIKHNMIYVLDPEFKKELFKFKYDELEATKVFPKLVHLILQNPRKDFKFNTTQSFEIKSLVTEYQSITNLLKRNSEANQDTEAAEQKSIPISS